MEILSQLGRVFFYDLDQRRAQSAAQLALQYGLGGADAVYAALAAEQGTKLKTLDLQLRKRYPGAES